MATFRTLLSLPFFVVSGIAMILMGLQLVVALLAVLNGVPIASAAFAWLVNTVVLTIVGVITGALGAFVKGSDPQSA